MLEVGTSNGYSTLWFADALQETGGHIDSIELDPSRHGKAREHVQESRLGDVVTLHQGDALQILPALQGPYDLAFIDADKP